MKIRLIKVGAITTALVAVLAVGVSASGQASKTDRTEQSIVYGRWKTAQNLRNSTVRFLQKQIDEVDSDAPVISSSTQEIGSLSALMSSLHESQSADIIERIKTTVRKAIGDDQQFFSNDDFVDISDSTAYTLNKDLGKEVFKPRDFVPGEEDYPKDRDITKIKSSMIVQLCDFVGVDPRQAVEPQDRHRWLTLWEWIDRVYVPVATRKLVGITPSTRRGN